MKVKLLKKYITNNKFLLPGPGIKMYYQLENTDITLLIIRNEIIVFEALHSIFASLHVIVYVPMSRNDKYMSM